MVVPAPQTFSCQYLHLITEPALFGCMETTRTKNCQKLVYTALCSLQFCYELYLSKAGGERRNRCTLQILPLRWNNPEACSARAPSFLQHYEAPVTCNSSYLITHLFINFLHFPISLNHSRTYVFWTNLPNNHQSLLLGNLNQDTATGIPKSS